MWTSFSVQAIRCLQLVYAAESEPFYPSLGTRGSQSDSALIGGVAVCRKAMKRCIRRIEISSRACRMDSRHAIRVQREAFEPRCVIGRKPKNLNWSDISFASWLDSTAAARIERYRQRLDT